jgi:hypothetical protein
LDSGLIDYNGVLVDFEICFWVVVVVVVGFEIAVVAVVVVVVVVVVGFGIAVVAVVVVVVVVGFGIAVVAVVVGAVVGQVLDPGIYIQDGSKTFGFYRNCNQELKMMDVFGDYSFDIPQNSLMIE